MKKVVVITVLCFLMGKGFSQVVEKGSKVYRGGDLDYEYYLNEIGDEIWHGSWFWKYDKYTYAKGQYKDGKKVGEWIYRSRGTARFAEDNPQKDSMYVVEHYSDDGLLNGIRETHFYKLSTKVDYHSKMMFKNDYCISCESKESWYEGKEKKQSIYNAILSENGILKEDWGNDPLLGKFHCYFDEYGFCKNWHESNHPHKERESEYRNYYHHKDEISKVGWYESGNKCYGLIRDTIKYYFPYESIMAEENPFVEKKQISSVFKLGDVTINVFKKFEEENPDVCNAIMSDYQYFKSIIGAEVEDYVSGKQNVRGCYKNIWNYFKDEHSKVKQMFCSGYEYKCSALEQYKTYCRIRDVLEKVDTIEIRNETIESLCRMAQRTDIASYVSYKEKYEKFLSIISQLSLPEKMSFLNNKLDDQIKTSENTLMDLNKNLKGVIDSLLEKEIDYTIGRLVKFSNGKIGIDVSIRVACNNDKNWCNTFYTEVAPKKYKKYDGSYAIETPQEVKLKELFGNFNSIVSYKILETEMVQTNIYRIDIAFEQKMKKKEPSNFYKGSVYADFSGKYIYILLDYSLQDLQKVDNL